jgi:Lauroyl/myristoyl acyltransferase
MNNLKYFAQFLGIIILLIIYKILGLKYSSILSGKILKILGPVFRSNNICHSNLAIAFPDLNKDEKEKIIKNMWNNYGKILAEYMYIKKFRNSETFSKKYNY